MWYLSDEDVTSYMEAINNADISDWAPSYMPNFIPVNVSSVESLEREIFANGKDFVIMKDKEGKLFGRYILLLGA